MYISRIVQISKHHGAMFNVHSSPIMALVRAGATQRVRVAVSRPVELPRTTALLRLCYILYNVRLIVAALEPCRAH